MHFCLVSTFSYKIFPRDQKRMNVVSHEKNCRTCWVLGEINNNFLCGLHFLREINSSYLNGEFWFSFNLLNYKVLISRIFGWFGN